jgi:hypothetical protein
VYSESHAPAAARILVGGDTVAAKFADVSSAVVGDFNDQLPLVVARTIARGAAKAVITRQAKEKVSEKHADLGRLVGLLGNAGNVLLEQADTRSWHLLPAGIAVVRLEVPAGSAQTLSAVVPGHAPVELGTIDPTPGGISFVTSRVW